MKNLFLIAIVVLLSSCMQTARIARTTAIDLKKYTDAGFWITESNFVNYDHTPVGLVSVYLGSGRAIKNMSKSGDEIYSNNMFNMGKYKEASLEEAIEMLYQKASALGANAIINLNYHYLPETKATTAAWQASGMAVNVK